MSLFQFSHADIPKLLEALWAMRSVGHFMGGYFMGGYSSQ
jgi:hypothetical protein